MRSSPTYALPTPDDLLELAREIRPDDAEELSISSHGLPALEALVSSCACSDALLSVRAEGALYCIMGIRAESLLDRTAVIWAIGTRQIDRRPLTFLRHSRSSLLLLCAALPWAESLHNAYLSTNTLTRRWLEWLGASFGSPFLPSQLNAPIAPPASPASSPLSQPIALNSPTPLNAPLPLPPLAYFTPFSIQRSDIPCAIP